MVILWINTFKPEAKLQWTVNQPKQKLLYPSSNYNNALATNQSRIMLDQTQIMNLESIAHHANAWCRCTNLCVHNACKAAYNQMHCSRTHTKHQEPTLRVDLCTVQHSSWSKPFTHCSGFVAMPDWRAMSAALWNTTGICQRHIYNLLEAFCCNLPVACGQRTAGLPSIMRSCNSDKTLNSDNSWMNKAPRHINRENRQNPCADI